VRMDLSLYVLTDRNLSRGRSHADIVRAAVAGGATAIQYREKEASTRVMVEDARELRAVARAAGVLFIVNDRVDVAMAVDADGVHVGQDDMPADLVRKLIGPDKIIGVSAGNVPDALRAEADGADYLGVGAIYATATKADAGMPTGLAALTEIKRQVKLPIVGIGGINLDNAAAVIKAGADGISVVSAVVSAEDVAEAARRLKETVLQSK
jgi:thiamine-phosphate pyrophosphorylase